MSAENDAEEVKSAEFEEQISNFHRMKMKKSRLPEGQHSIRLEAALTKGTKKIEGVGIKSHTAPRQI